MLNLMTLDGALTHMLTLCRLQATAGRKGVAGSVGAATGTTAALVMRLSIGSRGGLGHSHRPKPLPPTEARLGLGFWTILLLASIADLLWPVAPGFIAADPLTLTIVAGTAAVLGTGLSVAGQLQQAESASDAAEANAEIAHRQADVARDQAAQERRRAAIEAETFARASRRQQGTRVSAIGASGIALSGSALDVLADAAMEDEQQRLFILADGEQRAQARLAGASIEEATASEFQRQAAAERQAGRQRAAGTLLGGFTQTGLIASQSPSLRTASSGGSRTGSVPRTSLAGGHLNPSTGMFGRV